MMGETVTRNM